MLTFFMHDSLYSIESKTSNNFDYIIWVSSLNIRKEASLKSNIVTVLPKGTKLILLEKSNIKEKVILNNIVFKEYLWVKVKSSDGTINGWVHEAALIKVSHYDNNYLYSIDNELYIFDINTDKLIFKESISNNFRHEYCTNDLYRNVNIIKKVVIILNTKKYIVMKLTAPILLQSGLNPLCSYYLILFNKKQNKIINIIKEYDSLKGITDSNKYILFYQSPISWGPYSIMIYDTSLNMSVYSFISYDDLNSIWNSFKSNDSFYFFIQTNESKKLDAEEKNKTCDIKLTGFNYLQKHFWSKGKLNKLNEFDFHCTMGACISCPSNKK